jgi:glutamate dehydrogenase (NAD(P)+)
MEDAFAFADEFGPAKVIHVHEPGIGLRGTLVVDNVATGPSIGGLRMAPDVSTAECFRLARAMTFKNAAAGLAHGGGKSVLYGDPAMPAPHKQELIRAFAHALRNETDYIFGPDMGTDETCMAWVLEEVGRAVGLPRALGGIPLDEIGATGFGLRHAAEVAADHLCFALTGARIVVQGFGAVGIHAARFLAEQGCLIVAVSDSKGGVANELGLDLDSLITHKRDGYPVSEFPGGKSIEADALLAVECEVWIPAARPNVIRSDNADRLRARAVVPGANIAVTEDADARLYERGILYVPDFIANAGGVICAAMEYRGASQRDAFTAIEDRVRDNTRAVLEAARCDSVRPSEAARELALARVRAAMKLRRWSIF